MQEFDPMEHFDHFLRFWWLILAAALLGGLAGFVFSRANAPMYEAVAEFIVEIDLDKVPLEELDEYYTDLALETTLAALTSSDVLEQVYAEAARLGQDTTQWDVFAYTAIERQHAIWELRFRHTDAAFAQALVNWWAQQGYQEMLQMQAAGITPDYVVFSPPSLAHTPVEPVYFAANKLILAGSLVGWLVGLLFVEVAGKRLLSRPKS